MNFAALVAVGWADSPAVDATSVEAVDEYPEYTHPAIISRPLTNPLSI